MMLIIIDRHVVHSTLSSAPNPKLPGSCLLLVFRCCFFTDDLWRQCLSLIPVTQHFFTISVFSVLFGHLSQHWVMQEQPGKSLRFNRCLTSKCCSFHSIYRLYLRSFASVFKPLTLSTNQQECSISACNMIEWLLFDWNLLTRKQQQQQQQT